MTNRYVLRATLACIASMSCSRSAGTAVATQSVAGTVVGPWHAGAQVVYGKRWALGHEVAVAADGTFSIPSWATAVTAYFDANHNGKFDRFAEPGSVCALGVDGWKCELTKQRAVLHRTLTVRENDHHDSTYVFWEDYRSDGVRVEQSSFCVGDRCTGLRSSPFLSETETQVAQLTICGREGFPSQDATLRTSSGITTVSIAQPPALETHAQLIRRSADILVLFGSTAVDRMIIWTGVINKAGDIQEVYWNSEQADAYKLVHDEGQISVVVPGQAIVRCERTPKCVLVAQSLKYWNPADKRLSSATEYREILDFRQRI